MGTWTTIERMALLATLLAHLLLGWALNQLLRRQPPAAELSYTEVVFISRRTKPAITIPVEPSRSKPAPAVSTRQASRAVTSARVATDSAHATTRPIPATSSAASASAPVASEPARATLDLSVHTPDVVLIPARAPWERRTPLEAKSTRFAQHWREPMSISRLISKLTSGGIKDPAQLCSDGERLMQKRGCEALFNRGNPLPEELP